MEKRTKTILIITVSAILLTALSFGIYWLVKKDNPQTKDNDEPSNDNTDSNETSQINNYYNLGSPNSTSNPSSTNGNTIVPTYNSEKELSNSISQLKDRTLYAKRKEFGGWGFSNIRSSAEVNTDRGWYDFSDNLLTTINSGTPIGKVIEETTGLFNGYSYRWFKVKLYKAVGFWGDTYEGFVRADTVTFKPYEK